MYKRNSKKKIETEVEKISKILKNEKKFSFFVGFEVFFSNVQIIFQFFL